MSKGVSFITNKIFKESFLAVASALIEGTLKNTLLLLLLLSSDPLAFPKKFVITCFDLFIKIKTINKCLVYWYKTNLLANHWTIYSAIDRLCMYNRLLCSIEMDDCYNWWTNICTNWWALVHQYLKYKSVYLTYSRYRDLLLIISLYQVQVATYFVHLNTYLVFLISISIVLG